MSAGHPSSTSDFRDDNSRIDQLRYDGRVAVVTGAGSGLGREYALLLASRGASVLVNNRATQTPGEPDGPSSAERVASQIREAGGDAIADHHSVETVDAGQAIVDHALSAFGRLDILINNAGGVCDKSFRNMTAEAFENVIDVHLLGAFYTASSAWAAMRDQAYGRIVNVTSAAGLLGNFGQANYGAAKMGLVGLTKTLAVEGKKYNIHVNALAPMARTKMTESLLDEEVHLDPAQVASVAAYLVHENCAASGEIYSAGGGRFARYFIGLTQGHYQHDLDIESVRDHFDRASSTDGYLEPRAPDEELAIILQASRSADLRPAPRASAERL
jgi:NAD(P)-dependent dehydrogenase (short-subunit alcohol dehydrogenase family)